MIAGTSLPGASVFNRRPNTHGVESRRQIAGRSRRQTGMHPNRCVDIGVSLSHDRGRRPARREPCDIDPLRIDRMIAHDLPGDPRDERRLAFVTALIVWLEPVPAVPGIGQGVLLRIGGEEALLLGERVHPGSRGKVVRGLCATMQHHDQGSGSPRRVLGI